MATAAGLDQKTLEQLCINTIRILSVDAVQQANSGHPGLPLGAAAMAYTLWTKHLRFNPKDPLWHDRDRFILSAGHGSALLYSLLHLYGYDLPLDQLKKFRQFNSMTPGHPERGHTPGVEVATGPLGQGFANGVGFAMAEAFLAAHFNRPGHEIVNHHTYAIVSDGDLMEGITAEAASLAGHLKLGKIIYLYDDNYISLAGSTNLTFTEDVAKRFQAYDWHTVLVEDGNDVAAIDKAIQEAKGVTDKPSLILVRTHIGFGSPKKQDTFGVHGSPLGEEELQATKKALGWPTMDKFFLPGEATEFFHEAGAKGKTEQEEWQKRFDGYRAAFPAESAEFEAFMKGEVPAGLADSLPKFKPEDKPVATRVASGQALNAIAKKMANVMGGSADLNPSTNTALKDAGDFQPSGEVKGVQGAVGGPWGYGGRNVAFGVREHAMGAAVNGMAAHGGVLPFSATFMVFSDYMKPAVRLGALSKLHAIYVFTHDSVAVGEDGPTHEPIEHLAGLRAIPQLSLIRPADANETAEAWLQAVSHTGGPTLLVFTRQNVPILDRSKAKEPGVAKGGYILQDAENGNPDVILIGTGSEVSLCVKAAERLKGYGVGTRVVSLPSWDLFAKQDHAYQESVLPRAITKRVTVEAGATFGWERWATTEGVTVGIDHYGASAPGEEILKNFGFTAERLTAEALRLLGRAQEANKEYGGGETSMAPTAPTEGHS